MTQELLKDLKKFGFVSDAVNIKHNSRLEVEITVKEITKENLRTIQTILGKYEFPFKKCLILADAPAAATGGKPQLQMC